VTQIKICGITNQEDALACEAAGAHALGFVFAKSPRRITPREAQKISQTLSERVTRVGVFVDAPHGVVMRVADAVGLDLVQLHGFESRAYAEGLGRPFLKAFRTRDRTVLARIRAFHARFFLLDAFAQDDAAGPRRVDMDIAALAWTLGRMALAGGLTPGNVGQAVQTLRPWAVDVSSGVESWPGRKDMGKVREFISEVRRCSEKDTTGLTEAGLFRRLCRRP
jgi:phosphoribosylanthranilate isomerase